MKLGYYHFKVSNVTDDDLEKFKNNQDIKKIDTVYENGYGLLENSQNEYKPYLKLYSMNQEVFENLKFKIIEGRFPTSNNELIISSHIKENGKVEYKIGDKISVDIGERESLDSEKLDATDTYDQENEKLVNCNHKEFTIVRNYRETKL